MTPSRPLGRGLVLPSLAAACAFAALIGLGTWQMQRLSWKEALIANMRARFAAPPAALPPPAEWARLDAETDEFRRVRFKTELLNDKEALVFTSGSSLREDSGPGYWVFTPARVGDRTLLVNRGFVPEERKDPATRRDGEIAGPVEIVGVMRWPEHPGLFTPAADPARNLWFARDPAEMAQAKGLGQVAPFYVEQEAPPAPGGLPRVGTLRPSLPNNHFGYALTWYGLALVLAGSFAFWFVGRWRGR